MQRDGEWADELVIICMAIILEKDIWHISTTSNKEHPWSPIPGQIHGWPVRVKEPPLRMFTINRVHFEALVYIDPSVSAAYQCSDCQMTFSNTNDMVVHMVSHTRKTFPLQTL